jgi:hypothetical protein
LTNHSPTQRISLRVSEYRCGPVHANRCPRTASTIAPASASQPPRASAARQIARAPTACISTENADSSSPSPQFVRVTHPFHPLFGRLLPCVGKRHNRYGKRLLLQDDVATVWSVPPQWTDLMGPDPEVVIGRGRALLRAVDLMELACLVKRLSNRGASRTSQKRKDDYAASVR